MQVTPEERGKWFRLGLNGRFDAQGAGTVSETIEKALSRGWRFFELDMRDVDYLSSAGIRVLLQYYQKIRTLKGALSLTGVQERVMRILEMVGLYDLLSPAGPSVADIDHAPTASMDLPGWKLQEFALDGDGVLIPKFIGEPCTGIVRGGGNSACGAVPFPASTVALGVGALGFDEAQCRDRLGFFMAGGGIAAYKPAASSEPPDYVVYAEDYIPVLQSVSALTMSGNFSRFVSFECEEGQAIDFTDLGGCMLRILEKPAAGFVVIAECEKRVLMACGIMGGTARNDMKGWLRPWGESDTLSGHVHAAFFPYQPLRLGFVKLKETVAGLFEHELLDIVHIGPHLDPAPPRLLRGIAWFSPVETR